MQTFLPYESFGLTAGVLDKRRLNKQRIEAWQILQALTVPGYGWKNHPAVLMWYGHETWLVLYGIYMCEHWIQVGGKDNVGLLQRFQKVWNGPLLGTKPEWLGNKEFHRSHQSNLVRKFPEWYGQHFPNVPSDLPYVWPVRKTDIIKNKKGDGV